MITSENQVVNEAKKLLDTLKKLKDKKIEKNRYEFCDLKFAQFFCDIYQFKF